jgi:uncharacterized protein
MYTPRKMVMYCVLLLAARPLLAQNVQISTTQKAIDIVASKTIKVEPEIAIIRIGYRNYGPTKDAALNDNVKAATRITAAFKDLGLSGKSVETETVYVGEAQPSYGEPQPDKSRHFESSQGWAIRISVDGAQEVLDRILQAGANDLEGVEWEVKAPDALEAQADLAALVKARSLASRLAAESNQKIGDLLYISNTPGEPRFISVYAAKKMPSNVARGESIKLFPAMVQHEATVHVVFALE